MSEEAKVAAAGAGCGCLIVVVQVVVYAALLYAAYHFIVKFW